MEEKRAKKKNWKGLAAVAAALIFVVGGTLITREPVQNKRTGNTVYASGTSAANGTASRSMQKTYSASDMVVFEDYEEAAMSMDEPSASLAGDSGSSQAARQEKIIRSASFTIRTAGYDADLQALQDLTDQMGGRVEYLSASGDAASGQARSASLTLRIPASRLDEFLSGAQGIGSVTALTQEMEDVSDSYYDIQTRLDTQKKKLERLQGLMASASKVSDLIEIESAVADAQYYIDRYTAQLRGYDSKVDYSTVRVTLREIKQEETKEATWGQRILAGLEASLEDGWLFVQDMVIFLVSALPWLAAAGAAALGVRSLIKRKKKKNKENKE